MSSPVTTLSDHIRFIERIFGVGGLSRNSRNFDVRCPICDPKDVTKKKLSILLPEHRLHCWTCGYRAHTLAPLIRKYGTTEQLNEYRDKFMTVEERERSRNSCIAINLEQKKLELPKDFKLLVTARNEPDARAAWRYALERGLTDRDMWYFKLGISDEMRWSRRIIVPSFDGQGKLNYFVARAIDKFKRPKYDNPDQDKTPVIFNEINIDWTQRLVICEGVFDLFKCGENAVPLLGSDLNEQSALFSSILVNNTPVAIALDGDMWETKTLKAAKKLADYDVDVVLVDTRQFVDPGSASREQFKEALDAAKQLDWASTFLTRLGRVSRTTLAL